MSKVNGMAAMHLEFTDRVPRTEYSASTHWELVKAVTGIDVSYLSDEKTKQTASAAFMKAWDYAMNWSTKISRTIFGDKVTRMGHAEYAAGAVDFDTQTTELFEDPEDVFDYDLEAEYVTPDQETLIRTFNEHYRANCSRFDDCVNMTGVYVTCISGLIELMGWNTLLEAAGLDYRRMGMFTQRYCNFIMPYFTALAACEAPVVMVHDDIVWTSGAFIRPDFYRQFVFPNYRKMFQPLRDAGKIILFTSDGNYTEFIDDVAQCGVNGFVMEPMTDMARIAEKYGKTHIFVGNADTRVLLLGGKEDIRREVKRCMDIGKSYPGFIMAVGNHIPPNTPVDNALWYNEFVEEMRKR